MALRLEFIAILVTALASEYYWTERLLLLPTSTLEFLREAAASNLSTVVLVDGASRGSFYIHDVFQRSTAVQIGGQRRTYLRIDMRDCDTTVFAYSDSKGNFAVAVSGEFAQGGHPCNNAQGTRCLSNMMWGLPGQMDYDSRGSASRIAGLRPRRHSNPLHRSFDQTPIVYPSAIPPAPICYPVVPGTIDRASPPRYPRVPVLPLAHPVSIVADQPVP